MSRSLDREQRRELRRLGWTTLPKGRRPRRVRRRNRIAVDEAAADLVCDLEAEL